MRRRGRYQMSTARVVLITRTLLTKREAVIAVISVTLIKKIINSIDIVSSLWFYYDFSYVTCNLHSD
jgi:hypothetical protein